MAVNLLGSKGIKTTYAKTRFQYDPVTQRNYIDTIPVISNTSILEANTDTKKVEDPDEDDGVTNYSIAKSAASMPSLVLLETDTRVVRDPDDDDLL